MNTKQLFTVLNPEREKRRIRFTKFFNLENTIFSLKIQRNTPFILPFGAQLLNINYHVTTKNYNSKHQINFTTKI